jgi:hypothetical protein
MLINNILHELFINEDEVFSFGWLTVEIGV